MKTLLQNIWNEIIKFSDAFLEAAPIIIIALVLTVLFLWISKFLRKKVTNYLKLKGVDSLQINFLSEIVKIITNIIAVILFLNIIGKQSIVASILGAGAISAFVIGFAFKDIGENFLAGIILAFNRPFKTGDVVMINNIEGSVIDLNLRETHIKTFDGKDVYLPNGMLLKNPLYNYTIDGFLRQQFVFAFPYGTDLQLALQILLNTVNTIPGVLQEGKQAKAFISEAGSSNISIVTQYWINTTNSAYSNSEVKSLAIKSCLTELERKGITIIN